MTLEERLRAYGNSQDTSEEQIQKTIQISKEALYKSEMEIPMSDLAFLYQQAGFVQKRWWLIQGFVLAVLWGLLYISRNMHYMQRCMGIIAPLFVVLVIPELWKSQNNLSMEIEGASYFSIRKIYAARMLLFTLADIVLLSAFFLVSTITLKLTIMQLVIQFFLPMNVTYCICFRNLCSCKNGSDYSAFGMILIWTALWLLIVLNEKVYEQISFPVWVGILGFSVTYLAYCIHRVWKSCGQYLEVNSSWN